MDLPSCALATSTLGLSVSLGCLYRSWSLTFRWVKVGGGKVEIGLKSPAASQMYLQSDARVGGITGRELLCYQLVCFQAGFLFE